MIEYSSEKGVDAKIRRLVEENSGQIEAAAKRVLGSSYSQVIAELRQEVSINIWRMLEKGERIEHWDAFIYHCAHKRALDLLKKTRRRARHEVSLTDLKDEGEQAAEQRYMTRLTDVEPEVLRLLEEALAELPKPIRLTVLLRKGEGYSRAEVARMLQCSEATVDYRLRQGLQRLRKRLKKQGVQSC
jgi:RNA polymerase sigma factor (sigma-70 family)